MRDPACHHFGKLLVELWLHFGLKSAPRRDSRRFLAVWGGLLGRSWVALGRFGALRALLGYPRACLGPIFEGFGMDLEVCTAKEEGIHNEKNDVVSPLQTLQDLPLQVPGLRAASKPMPTTTRRTPLWYRCPSLFSPYLEDRGPQIGLGGRRVAQTFFLNHALSSTQ